MAYGEYNGRCIGRLMHFLYYYHHRTDECIFHEEHEDPMITLWGKPFANYEWDGDTDIPTFTFLGEWEFLNKTQKVTKENLLKADELREKIFGETENKK